MGDLTTKFGCSNMNFKLAMQSCYINYKRTEWVADTQWKLITEWLRTTYYGTGDSNEDLIDLLIRDRDIRNSTTIIR